MGVVSSDHGESVRLSGQLCGSLDGSVEHHSFRQSQFGYAIVVAVINSPSYISKKQKNQHSKPFQNPFFLMWYSAY